MALCDGLELALLRQAAASVTLKVVPVPTALSTERP